jgi:methylase of polypeptide subunit release factors
MENIHLDLSDHQVDVILNALQIATENADEYESGEYEEVLFELQKKLDEDYDFDVE